MKIRKLSIYLAVLYTLVDSKIFEAGFDDDDIDTSYGFKYLKSKMENENGMNEKILSDESSARAMISPIKSPSFLKPKKIDMYDLAIKKEIDQKYYNLINQTNRDSDSDSIKNHHKESIHKPELIKTENIITKSPDKERVEPGDRNLTRLYLEGKSEFDAFDKLPLHKIYSMSFSEPIVYSNITVCPVCPNAFLTSFSQNCRNTFAIVLSSKGFARVFTYIIEYRARYLNGQDITGAELETLANIEVCRIKETSQIDPFLSNLDKVSIFPKPIDTTFTLAFTMFSNDLDILDILYIQLKIIASLNVNISGKTAQYLIDDKFKDIDECKLGLDTCTKQQICINTIGSYFCACPEGKVLDTNKDCICVQSTPYKVTGYYTLSFGGRTFLIPIPPFTDYMVSAIIMIVIFALLAIANVTAYVCP